jgi:hypothetical protein
MDDEREPANETISLRHFHRSLLASPRTPMRVRPSLVLTASQEAASNDIVAAAVLGMAFAKHSISGYARGRDI